MLDICSTTPCRVCKEEQKLTSYKWCGREQKFYLRRSCNDCYQVWRTKNRIVSSEKIARGKQRYNIRKNGIKGGHTELTQAQKTARESRRVYNQNWVTNHPEKVKAYKLQQELSGTTFARRYRHEMGKKNAYPLWDRELTDFVCKEASHLAKLREIATGFKWHLDHIIPLRGLLVSGLHVWNNFAVIPASINISKSNNYAVQ